MIDFHLAPWRNYKGILGAFALAAPIVYYAAWSSLTINSSESGFLGVSVMRWTVVWLVGWFFILFGDGAYGVLFPRSLRRYYVTLGVLMLALPAVRAWVYYDRDAISSRVLEQRLPDEKRLALRDCLDPTFPMSSVPSNREYDFYAILRTVRPVLTTGQRVLRVEFNSSAAAILRLSDTATVRMQSAVYLRKSAGQWSIDKMTVTAP